MKRLIAIAVLAAGLQVVGCTPSVHPLYTPEDVVFEPALLGDWSGNNFGMTFTRHDGNAYRVVHRDKHGNEGTFRVHLVKLDGHRFLDFFPEHDVKGDEVNGFYEFHLLPTHTFMRVDQVTPTLKLAPLNPKWVEEYLSEHPQALRHELTENRIVLTAPTEDLQSFVSEHRDTDDAWGKPTELERADNATNE